MEERAKISKYFQLLLLGKYTDEKAKQGKEGESEYSKRHFL